MTAQTEPAATLNEAQTQVTTLEAELQRLEAESATVDAQRVALQAQTVQTRRDLTAAKADLERQRRPSDPAKLADLCAQLRQRIKASPRRSYTAERAAELLERLDDETIYPTTADAIAAVQGCLKSYRHDLEYVDPNYNFPDAPRLAGRE